MPAVSFELPDSGLADSARPGLVALLLPGDGNDAQASGLDVLPTAEDAVAWANELVAKIDAAS